MPFALSKSAVENDDSQLKAIALAGFSRQTLNISSPKTSIILALDLRSPSINNLLLSKIITSLPSSLFKNFRIGVLICAGRELTLSELNKKTQSEPLIVEN